VAEWLSPKRLAAAGLVLLVAVTAILFITPADETYIFLPHEAQPVAPLLEVEGAAQAPMNGGGIYFVDVLVRKATLIERFFPSIRDGATLVPAEQLNPTGVSEDVRREGNLREMSRSQRIAAAVALRALGRRVQARPTGAFVANVLPSGPATGVLQHGDVIVAVGGKPVTTPQQLRGRIGPKKPGTVVELTVKRGERVQRFRLKTAAASDGRAVVGIVVEPEVDVTLPVDVTIDAGDVGGPSAGLAFALAIMEKLGRDVDHGRKVAATGELELDGDVLPIGGVEQKTIGAERADVDVFLVPAGDNATEARRYADDVRVVGVKTFQQALRTLATTPVGAPG
jgi:PDZ domain-containing protein